MGNNSKSNVMLACEACGQTFAMLIPKLKLKCGRCGGKLIPKPKIEPTPDKTAPAVKLDK